MYDDDVDTESKGEVSRKILSFFLINPQFGNEKWTEDKLATYFMENVNKTSLKMDEAEYVEKRKEKNTPQGVGTKPPEWIQDDPLTRIVMLEWVLDFCVSFISLLTYC